MFSIFLGAPACLAYAFSSGSCFYTTFTNVFIFITFYVFNVLKLFARFYIYVCLWTSTHTIYPRYLYFATPVLPANTELCIYQLPNEITEDRCVYRRRDVGLHDISICDLSRLLIFVLAAKSRFFREAKTGIDTAEILEKYKQAWALPQEV